MASWAGALAAVQADLVLAAAVVNALFPDKDPFVPAPGEPVSGLARRLRYWYDGDQESTTGGKTLGKNNVQEKVTIRWYWPVLNRDDKWTSDLEVQLQAANRATQKYLLLDEHLKNAGTENCIGVDIGPGSAGWQQVGEAWIRVLSLPLLVDMAWTEDIGTL
jgi:hypothetical protein